ncbi:MAG: hypothetical protein ACRCYR_03835 [Phycicoccus sp.]
MTRDTYRRHPPLCQIGPRPAVSANPHDPPLPSPAVDLSHSWVSQATIDLDEKLAKHANLRLSFRLPGGTRIDSLEVMCKACRRPFDDVADLVCEAKIDNTHLIGGDQSVRAKRNSPVIPDGAVVVPGPRINRRGIDAVLSREA